MAEAVASRLEELIRSESERVAAGMLQVAKAAHSEEDVRAGVARLLDDFIEVAKLTVDKGHEYGVGTRRLDSKYSWVFIEYKHSKGSAAITENANAPGTQAVIDQLRTGFDNLRKKEKADPKKLFGVGTDGPRDHHAGPTLSWAHTALRPLRRRGHNATQCASLVSLLSAPVSRFQVPVNCGSPGDCRKGPCPDVEHARDAVGAARAGC